MHDSRVLIHITLYQRANTNQMLLEAKVNVNGHMLLGDEVSVKLTSKAIHIPSKSFSTRGKLRQKFGFSKSNCGVCIWETKSEMEMLINNAEAVAQRCSAKKVF